MAKVIGLSCVCCGTLYPPDHYAQDCPRCCPEACSNLTVTYHPSVHARRDKPVGRGNGLKTPAATDTALKPPLLVSGGIEAAIAMLTAAKIFPA